MFKQKKLILIAILVLLAVMISVPALGASFRKKISDQQFIDMCKEGDSEILNLLIKSGANVNAKDYKGRTALMWAAMFGHTGTVNVLIEAGADDLTDNEGKTALIHAARSENSNEETVNLLIEAGSYVKQKDNDGNTALDYARNNPKLKGSNVLKRLEELSK